MIRFAIVGSGWRSLFYVRIAKALPEEFELVGMLVRTPEKAQRLAREYQIPTTLREENIIERKPDFIVSAVNKAGMWDTCKHWLELGFPVLSETPATLEEGRMEEIRKLVAQGAKYQVAEQYFLYPRYREMITLVESGLIGEPVSMTISCMHDYHCASVIRRLLQVEGEAVSITGKAFSHKVTDTKTRYETLTDGKVVEKEHRHLIMEYESGKTAFYDFMSDQYRSPIRNRYINVRGTRGEIVNDVVYYLGEDNLARSRKLELANPYEKYGLDEDEAAITEIMKGMAVYIRTGKEIYPVAYALEDAVLANRMTGVGK